MSARDSATVPDESAASVPIDEGILLPVAVLSLPHIGTTLGFFYVWACSTMWGLDASDLNVAIPAVQAMNEGVRDPVCAPAFLGIPPVLMVPMLVTWQCSRRRAVVFFASGATLHFLVGLMPTLVENFPMNKALAMVETPLDATRAQDVWLA